MNAFVKIKGHAPFGQSPEGASLFCAAGNQKGRTRCAFLLPPRGNISGGIQYYSF